MRAEEVMLDLPGGRTITTLVNATPIYAEDGKIVSAAAMIQDMTPLEELERLRNEFLAIVSHEMRTPLTTIKGCASMVLNGSSQPSTPALLEYFQMIDEQSDKLHDLINNLLDMTQIEAGTLSVTLKTADLKSIVDEARATFLRTGVHNIVEQELPVDLPQVTADRQRIIQVLPNLLSNASKYSEDGSRIGVTACRDEIYVVISVSDEGRGLHPENLRYLFKKFSRVSQNGTESEVVGEGLGLAICKGIVEAHGGRIWAESAGEGYGTRVRFTIPQADPIGEVRGGLPSPALSGDEKRILMVDDEPQVLRLLTNILLDHGYKPFGTGDPDEMPYLLDTERPHLVLLDLMIPGARGHRLMECIHQVSDVPIIFLSANDAEEKLVKALSRGADDYIVKPFSPTELVARIEVCLRRHESTNGVNPRQSYHLGNLTIDYESRTVTLSGQPTPLSSTEYRLVCELSRNAGRVLTHNQILERVWGPEYPGENQLLRATIKNLRRKLKDDANNPTYIFTEPRVGYRMKRSA